MTSSEAAVGLFRARFGGEPEFIVRSPGRVNLIGEHTDYNDGFVLPMAIEQSTWVALRSSDDRTVRLSSIGHPDAEFDLDALTRGNDGWAEYVKGIAWAIGAEPLRGWEGAFATSIPIGAGLSSSAALGIASALAFTVVSGEPWRPVEAALAAQRVENDWMGLGSGIMDQLIIATAKAGHATLIDCRSLDLAPTALPDDMDVVILDTGTRRQLVGSEYDDRRNACERVAKAAHVVALRDLSIVDLEAMTGKISDDDLRRARHVVTENARTIEAAAALDTGDVRKIGELMDDAHRSIRDDFEASSSALDLMVEIASDLEGCLGARMTGGGFGGCAVALVRGEKTARFVEEITRRYEAVSDNEAKVYVTRAAAGASIDSIGDPIE
ncbi:MAG: galactokinase [Actinomycetia bacterium]|nr:galactokinase [Actinomycetes bacterium]